MTRAALLPAGADPYLNAYWLRHYARVWADEVDELRVIFCGVPPEHQRSLAELALSLPHVEFTFQNRADHGVVIGQLIDSTSADLVLLCEDDAFIRRKGAVATAFGRIESGQADVVGCPRTSATPDVADAAIRQFGNLVSETGEEGPALWPCFLFARRADLLATDHHFGAAHWQPGDLVPGLDYRATTESAADTFVGTSYQLRRAGLRVHVEAEYRADLAKMPGWSDPPWFHVGSLSSGYGHYFLAGMSDVDRLGHAAHVRNDQLDWRKRLSWWQRVAGDDEYRAAVEQMRVDFTIEQEHINEWARQFDRLISW